MLFCRIKKASSIDKASSDRTVFLSIFLVNESPVRRKNVKYWRMIIGRFLKRKRVMKRFLCLNGNLFFEKVRRVTFGILVRRMLLVWKGIFINMILSKGKEEIRLSLEHLLIFHGKHLFQDNFHVKIFKWFFLSAVKRERMRKAWSNDKKSVSNVVKWMKCAEGVILCHDDPIITLLYTCVVSLF